MIWQILTCAVYQCDFRFDLFFSFSFVPVLSNLLIADEDVLMICLNTVHRESRIQRRTAVAPVSAVLYPSTFVEWQVLLSFSFSFSLTKITLLFIVHKPGARVPIVNRGSAAPAHRVIACYHKVGSWDVQMPTGIEHLALCRTLVCWSFVVR